MYQAIVTKYLAPTNHRGARIRAKASGGSLTVEYDYEHGDSVNHRLAASAFAKKMGWQGTLITGGLPNGDRVHVFATL